MADETPKTEPTPIVTDAPSIAAGDQAPNDASAKPETAEAAAKIETPEAPKAEAKIEPGKIEPKAEAPTLPPAAQLAEPNAIIPFQRPAPKTEQPVAPQARTARFALLAACVAIAASFGAIGGSLGVAKFGPMIASAPAPVAPVAPVQKENVADEMKALKETVTQLRTATRALSENLAALRLSVTTSNTAQNAQIGKIAETLDRVEKGQAEQRRAAAAATSATSAAAATAAAAAAATSATSAAAAANTPPDITGSIATRPAATEPNGALKNSIVQGWVLRRVLDGAALIESRDGLIEVEPGDVPPGLGRIEAIKRQDGRWVVVTPRGLVVGR